MESDLDFQKKASLMEKPLVQSMELKRGYLMGVKMPLE